ncbi:MAG: mechanosensitive ion channel domain-containing protein [Actinomycetes bacterium]
MKTNFTFQSAYDWFSGAPLHILAIIAIALVVRNLGARAIAKAINRLSEADIVPGPKHSGHRQKERAKTAGTVLRSAMNAAIILISATMVLSEFGLNLGPLIASAGVIGVALGLGAQTIVRDVLAGIFMLIEDQYGVGDEVEALEIKGVVESVGLRITTIRSTDGSLWYLRNGEILKLGNRSQPKH